jgi:signal transduction histidine kinase
MGLINDILDMSKLESRKLDLNCETVQAKEFISRLVELIKPQFQVKNINFVVTARGDKQKYLQLDKLRCQQIFMNIFSNAAKFTQNNGRVEMLIDTKKNSADKVLVTIKAKDNGIGMSREFLKKIFQPFEQENDAGKQICRYRARNGNYQKTCRTDGRQYYCKKREEYWHGVYYHLAFDYRKGRRC